MARIARPFTALAASGLLLLSLFPAGCGDGRPNRVPVSGRVTIDGKPLPAGFIRVCPANQRAATGAIGPDGRFKLTTFNPNDGCVVGKHCVTVAGSEVQGAALLWHAPKKYCDMDTSRLEVEITGPTDNVEINLTWDGGKPFKEYLDGERIRGGRK
jgi:hypothetical protein